MQSMRIRFNRKIEKYSAIFFVVFGLFQLLFSLGTMTSGLIYFIYIFIFIYGVSVFINLLKTYLEIADDYMIFRRGLFFVTGG